MKGGRKALGPEDRPRGTSEGFSVYMMTNPHYFEGLAHMRHTAENIRTFWRGLRRDGLIAAPHAPPKGCRCRFCVRGKAPSRGRIIAEEEL